MSVCSQAFYAGSAGLQLSDFTLLYNARDVAPITPISSPSLALESLSTQLGVGWYRLTGLLNPPNNLPVELVVLSASDPSVVYLRQEWPDLTDVKALEATLAPVLGNIPVTLRLYDALSALPISGVTVSIWNPSTGQAVIPGLLTNVSGRVVMSLPVGNYQAYFFKAFAIFPNLPATFTVVSGPAVTFNFSGTDAVVPVVPTILQVTIYGWVLYPNGVAAQGVEVKMRLKDTPQMKQSVGFSRAFVAAITDADGHFEISCAGGLYITLECETVGYSRKGKLPNDGSINWSAFAVASV